MFSSRIKYIDARTLRNKSFLKGVGYFVDGIVIVGASVGANIAYVAFAKKIESSSKITPDQKEKIGERFSIALYPTIGLGLLGTAFCWRQSYHFFRTSLTHHRNMKKILLE